MRYSPFARDFHDLHGEAEVSEVPPDPVTGAAISFSLALAVIALSVFSLAFVIAAAVFVFSAFVPHPISRLDPDLIPPPAAVGVREPIRLSTDPRDNRRT
jgi:hypothetical protein